MVPSAGLANVAAGRKGAPVPMHLRRRYTLGDQRPGRNSALALVLTVELYYSKRMARNKNRHRSARRSAHKKQEELHVFAHPFASLDAASVKAAMLAMANRKIDEFPQSIGSILDIFRRKYPPHIISVVA